MALAIRNVEFTQQNIEGIANALNGQTRTQVAEAYRQVLGMTTIPFYPGHYNNPLENRMRDISGVFIITITFAVFIGGMVCLWVSAMCYSVTWQLGCTITASVFGSIAGLSLIGLAGNEIRRHIYWSEQEQDIQGRLTALMEKALATWENPDLYREYRINFGVFERAIRSYYGEGRCAQGIATRNEQLVQRGRGR